jgi:hypothetical protein
LRDDGDEINERLTEQLEAVLDKFWSGWRKRGNSAYPEPNSKTDLGSFVVYLAPVGRYKRGEWFHSSQSRGGGPLNLFAYGQSVGTDHRVTAETFRGAREFLGLADAIPETEEQRAQRIRRQEKAAEKRKQDERLAQERAIERMQTASELWNEGVAIKGTHSESYLLERIGVEPKGGWPDVLRHHPGLVYSPPEGGPDKGRVFPVLLCKVTNSQDEIIAVWRIYLHPTKPEKAPVAVAKLGLGPAGGGAVRIGGTGPVIGVAEGLETAIGAWLYVDQRYPVWAALSTSGMKGLEIPFEVDERVYIFPDGDKAMRRVGPKDHKEFVVAEPAGRKAADALFRAIPDLAIKQPEPKRGQDYLNLWRAKLDRITYG